MKECATHQDLIDGGSDSEDDGQNENASELPLKKLKWYFVYKTVVYTHLHRKAMKL